IQLCVCYSFFLSSRRRHTRSKRDWSSDVCSSDLWLDNFTFIQGADTQFGLIDYIKNNWTDTGTWSTDLSILKDAINEWNGLNPRSEERRVGKEGRARRAERQEQKKRSDEVPREES